MPTHAAVPRRPRSRRLAALASTLLQWSGGTFLGLVQGVGAELGTGRWRTRPSLSVVVGRAERTSYGERHGPATRVFMTAAMGLGYELGRR